MRPCVKCGSIDRYKKSNACRPCNIVLLAKHRKENPNYDKKWRKKNPEVKLSINRRSRYGLTQDQYIQMFNDQNGKCKICKTKSIRDVDHCHKTGKIRGLLCQRCNLMLGYALDDPEILRLGAEYLEEK